MPLLTPHWNAPPKKPRVQRTSEEIKSRQQMRDKKKYQKKLDAKVYDPSTMTLLERSSLERSKLTRLHHNRDIKIGGPWGPIIARRVARCLVAMNPEVDILILTNTMASKPPYNEWNKEYFDVFVRYHRTTFDGQRIPEIGEI